MALTASDDSWRQGLRCPRCRRPFFDGDTTLICPGCGKSAHVAPGHLDFSAFLPDSATEAMRRVSFAYRFYSILYAPLALLNMLTVWRARLLPLIDHYGKSLATTTRPILDIAIGDGSLTRTVLRRHALHAPLLGLDFSPHMLEKARTTLAGQPGFVSVLADACAIPFADQTFHTVCCYGGFHVMAHPEVAAAEMRRVLTPTGVLHASILLRPPGRVSRALTESYVRDGFLSTCFSGGAIRLLLENAGFRVLAWERNGFMLLLRAAKR